MNPYYASITHPEFLDYKIRMVDALPVMKKNRHTLKTVLTCLNAVGKPYYLYFLDGDQWGMRDAWQTKTFVDRYDFQFSYDLFSCVKFKDCAAQWADEYILISPVKINHKIDQIIRSRNFTMTKLVHRSNSMSYETIVKLSHIVRAKKNIKRGIWYDITIEDMEVTINDNRSNKLE